MFQIKNIATKWKHYARWRCTNSLWI